MVVVTSRGENGMVLGWTGGGAGFLQLSPFLTSPESQSHFSLISFRDPGHLHLPSIRMRGVTQPHSPLANKDWPGAQDGGGK